MIIAALTVGVLVFVSLLRAFNAGGIARRAIVAARGAAATLRNEDLSDDQKERASRDAAGRLFGSFLAIALIGCVACGGFALLVWAGSAAGLYPLDAALATAASWQFLVISTLVGTGAWMAMERVA